jgi:ketosteroid isomerase-like protein
LNVFCLPARLLIRLPVPGANIEGLMRSTVLLGLFFVTVCMVTLAQGGTTVGNETGRILSLESAWNQAEVQHDARAMSMLLAETFEYTESDGRFMDKRQWLDFVTKGVEHYDQLGNSGIEVHIYGDVAVVTGGYRERIKTKNNSVVRGGRFTDIWLQQNGQWKCIASQATLISR